MKILIINSVCGVGSTGRICVDIAQKLESYGHEVKIAYGRSNNVPELAKKYAVRIGNDWDRNLHLIRTRVFDEHGLGSSKATRRFLRWAEEYDPDLLWLHNLHGYYINYELLFDWIKCRPNMQVRWTLHDCWAFTGHCTHFMAVDCNQWKTHCIHCCQTRHYPASYARDNCSMNFTKKKNAFTGVKNMTIITPSCWLADLAKESFLGEYPIEVLHNTIDTSVFKPTEGDFRKRYGLEDKFIILGVANVWNTRKGFNDFLKLADMLDDRFVIVLVGVSGKQLKDLPPRIVGIQKISDPHELAEIYSAADLFFNPTHEDNYPTVNLEAEACGTPVVTYAVGGAPETIRNENSVAIKPRDVESAFNFICKSITMRRK